MTEHGPELDATDARQGQKGVHVLVILGVSLTLIVIAFVALFVTKSGDLAGHGGQSRITASSAQPGSAEASAPTTSQLGDAPAPTASQPSETEARQ